MSDIFGKKLGQYVLLEQLGEGGMAKVYNALDERVERNVAIKVILPNKRSSQVFLQQFDREAKALANLTHTNIVKVLNYGTEDGQPYLVMEYIQGGTLKDAVTGTIPWPKAAEILAPIARALDYVHHQNIVHQDIKPSNILLDEEFRPMLSDFGVVKLLEAKEGENAAIGVGVGTPDYMSPEQSMGKDVDFRADIYSLGVVFYELVTGEKPFVADTPMALVIKHVTDQFPLPRKINKSIPKFVENAILRAVQKDPQGRYASMAQFADVLELIALGEHAPEKKILFLTRNNKRKIKTIPIVLLSVFFILAFVAAGIAAFWIGGNLGRFDQAARIDNPTVALTKKATSSVKIPATASAEPEATATAEPEMPTPTIAQLPVQAGGAEITLLGTPISTTRETSGFAEIARWGIGGVNKVKWSPDGETIALGTTSGIFLYNSTTKEMKRFINTGFDVTELTFSPDSSMLMAGSLNGQVKLWNSVTGDEQNLDYSNQNSAVTAISFSKNGKNVVIGSQDGNFFVIALNQAKTIMTGQQYPAIEDAFTSADERFLFLSNGEATIFVWDISAQKLVSELKNPTNVNKLVASPDRQFMLSAGNSNVVYFWDITEQRVVNGFPNLGGNVTDMDFSPDGGLIIIGLDNGKIKVFAKPDLKDSSKTQLPILTIDASVNRLRSIAFSPTKMVIASGAWEDGLKIWDAQTGANVYSLNQSMGRITKIQFSPDAVWLATAHEGNIVRVWEVKAAKEAYRVDGYLPKGEPFSPNGQFLTVIKPPKNSYDLAVIQIVELSTGKIVRELLGYEPNFFLQFSDDTKLLITGIPEKATIWDVSSWEKVNMHGGVTAGCGQFFTPENGRLTVISSVGILFTYSPTDANMCGTKPKGATFVYYFKQQERMVFVLGNGQIWTWDFFAKDISIIDPKLTYPSPGDVFLGANQTSGLYASVSGNSLIIKNIIGDSYSTIPGQDDYGYQVAFLPTQKIFALGSKYGSIHIWTLP